LGDEKVAALIRPELEASAGSAVTVDHGVAFYGATDSYLGMLASGLETRFRWAVVWRLKDGKALSAHGT
jgi:hypothetical protein